jgi:hypothetical protein
MRRGGRMEMAKKALTLFIRSLPPGSRFNIVSFGTYWDCLDFKKKDIDSGKDALRLAEYNSENMNYALQEINKFNANYGGTEMYDPFEAIMKVEPNTKYQRNIFILTDGKIFDTKKLLNLIKNNNKHTRVHSFGVGSGTSIFLVKEIAKNGNGSSTLVRDGDSDLNEKVIRALSIASKPAFISFKLDWGANEKAVIFKAPGNSKIPNIYEEEPFHVYAILSKNDLKNDELAITFYDTNIQKERTIRVSIDPHAIKTNDGLFHLAARQYIEGQEKGSKEILDASVKYSVLSDQVAFFGKIKNYGKSGEEMKLINIPVHKLKEFEDESSDYSDSSEGGNYNINYRVSKHVLYYAKIASLYA